MNYIKDEVHIRIDEYVAHRIRKMIINQSLTELLTKTQRIRRLINQTCTIGEYHCMYLCFPGEIKREFHSEVMKIKHDVDDHQRVLDQMYTDPRLLKAHTIKLQQSMDLLETKLGAVEAYATLKYRGEMLELADLIKYIYHQTKFLSKRADKIGV